MIMLELIEPLFIIVYGISFMFLDLGWVEAFYVPLFAFLYRFLKN
jgi:hypothetical protein